MRAHRCRLGPFLSGNPFERGWTDGLFYREKMRAIHRVAPPHVDGPLLDIGGGSSGLLAALYPSAAVISLDIDVATFVPRSHRAGVVGDGRCLPFADQSFALVSLFDVLEHIDDHASAVIEARRVLRPGGSLLVSTPAARWRYPRFRPLTPHVRSEEELMAEWGHVRRGYESGALDKLVGLEPAGRATFGGLLVSPFHDIAFSGWSNRRRRWAYVLLSAPVWLGYAIEKFVHTGNELVRSYGQPSEMT